MDLGVKERGSNLEASQWEKDMNKPTQVFLFGSLRKAHGEFLTSSLPAPICLTDLLKDLQIPPDRVQLAMVNHRAVPPDQVIHPGDRVSLFPKEYMIFADWKDFRL